MIASSSGAAKWVRLDIAYVLSASGNPRSGGQTPSRRSRRLPARTHAARPSSWRSQPPPPCNSRNNQSFRKLLRWIKRRLYSIGSRHVRSRRAPPRAAQSRGLRPAPGRAFRFVFQRMPSVASETRRWLAQRSIRRPASKRSRLTRVGPCRTRPHSPRTRSAGRAAAAFRAAWSGTSSWLAHKGPGECAAGRRRRGSGGCVCHGSARKPRPISQLRSSSSSVNVTPSNSREPPFDERLRQVSAAEDQAHAVAQRSAGAPGRARQPLPRSRRVRPI